MKLRKWEIALYIAFAAAVLVGAGLMTEQRQLSEKIIRLHVVANSDSEEDQTLKLEVRDRVLTELDTILAGVTDRGEAERLIAENLDLLKNAAGDEINRNGYDYAVRASLGLENYPTREYETFSLPAGQYESLRFEIGGGGGKNWWCVVFPPICAESSGGLRAALEALSEEELALITEDSTEYVVKFKIIEFLGTIRTRMAKK